VSKHDREVVHAARGQIYSREVIPYDIRHALCRGVCPEGIDNPKVLYPQLLTVQKGRLPAIHIELRMARGALRLFGAKAVKDFMLRAVRLSFAEKTLVAAGQCTKITADISPEQYAAIGLLGCGVTAGVDSILVGWGRSCGRTSLRGLEPTYRIYQPGDLFEIIEG